LVSPGHDVRHVRHAVPDAALYLQAGRGDGALQAAIELLPLSVAFVIVPQLSGKIANAYGPRLPMTLGMAMMGTGLSMLGLIPLNNSARLHRRRHR
jgi:MFS family permease